MARHSIFDPAIFDPFIFDTQIVEPSVSTVNSLATVTIKGATSTISIISANAEIENS
ncbi:MAG: hypothetical protein ACYCQJ_15235 [Nitrososphaerales archaeon]